MQAISHPPAAASERPSALVTGASEGFGRALAREIAADGFDLFVVARNEARLESLADELRADFDVEVRVRHADLCEAAEQAALAEEVRRLPKLALLVNNAAFSVVDAFAEIPVERVQQIVALNLGALAVLTQAALGNEEFRRGGTLLNIGSVGGTFPLPFDAIYSATKAAVHHFSAAIAYEVEKDPDVDVHVQVAKLGNVLSGWADRSMGSLEPGEKSARWLEWMSTTPETAARTIWRKTKRRDRPVVADHWIAAFQARFLGAFPRLGSAMVHANSVRELSRRTRP